MVLTKTIGSLLSTMTAVALGAVSALSSCGTSDASADRPHGGSTKQTSNRAVLVHEASGIQFVFVDGGEYMMGSPRSEPWHHVDERQQSVTVAAFYIAKFEVTIGQWRRFVEATGYISEAERELDGGGDTVDKDGGWRHSPAADWETPLPHTRFNATDEHPVTQVTWNDAVAYCAHYGMDLPTQAEWEYACRAGSAAMYPWGDDVSEMPSYENVGDWSAAAEFIHWQVVVHKFIDDQVFLDKVGSRRANAWGLHDMIGNVEEWCKDGPESPDQVRYLRGGSWACGEPFTRPARRGSAFADRRSGHIGFRPVLRPRQ